MENRLIGSTEAGREAREALARRQQERMAAGLPANPTPGERAAENPKSRQLAINAMCWHCMGELPEWRGLVRDCTASGCPLYDFRPGA